MGRGLGIVGTRKSHFIGSSKSQRRGTIYKNYKTSFLDSLGLALQLRIVKYWFAQTRAKEALN